MKDVDDCFRSNIYSCIVCIFSTYLFIVISVAFTIWLIYLLLYAYDYYLIYQHVLNLFDSSLFFKKVLKQFTLSWVVILGLQLVSERSARFEIKILQFWAIANSNSQNLKGHSTNHHHRAIHHLRLSICLGMVGWSDIKLDPIRWEQFFFQNASE